MMFAGSADILETTSLDMFVPENMVHQIWDIQARYPTGKLSDLRLKTDGVLP